MYKQFKQGRKHLSLWHSHLRFLHQEEQLLRPANFYSVFSRTTFFSANEVSFSLGECSLMRIEYQ